MWNTASNSSSISYIWCDVFWLSVGSNIGMCCERQRAYAQMKHDLPHRDKDCTHEFRLNPSIECVRLRMISQVKSSASHWQDGQTMIYCSRWAFTVQWVCLENHWKSHMKVTEERRQFWRWVTHGTEKCLILSQDKTWRLMYINHAWMRIFADTVWMLVIKQ